MPLLTGLRVEHRNFEELGYYRNAAFSTKILSQLSRLQSRHRYVNVCVLHVLNVQMQTLTSYHVKYMDQVDVRSCRIKASRARVGRHTRWLESEVAGQVANSHLGRTLNGNEDPQSTVFSVHPDGNSTNLTERRGFDLSTPNDLIDSSGNSLPESDAISTGTTHEKEQSPIWRRPWSESMVITRATV
ncbi:hypothetical protein BO70DRAFT_395362 [Aspergillus heteromorphus CBS 117.55]|uniref:Uncharacterized protein n=1 Tax=Aspergillus heteromorphus CBS 117.55 TaxID=1448321 RepID=A0A317WMH8_9EURO|nr:uncharacterized protein BO70DRAFT_395362 [Aspergillus heteromorphus CBS 117.55]PWY86257.1 hypothetical protein BO70DRAFT_395362 [Aspergillus heteromorphus CBS 117.55]